MGELRVESRASARRPIRRPVPLGHEVVESEQVLGAVPSRLDGHVKEVDPERAGVLARQLALARTAQPAQHREWREVVDFQTRVERLESRVRGSEAASPSVPV